MARLQKNKAILYLLDKMLSLRWGSYEVIAYNDCFYSKVATKSKFTRHSEARKKFYSFGVEMNSVEIVAISRWTGKRIRAESYSFSF